MQRSVFDLPISGIWKKKPFALRSINLYSGTEITVFCAQSFMKKKGLIPLVLFLLLVSGLTFRHVFVEQAIKWILHTESIERFGQSVQYQNFSLKDGHLVLNEVIIFDTTADPDGGYRLEVEQIDFRYNFDFWNRQLSMDVTHLRPKLTAVRKQLGEMPPFPLHPCGLKTLEISSNLFLVDGTVELNSQIPSAETLQRFYVDFEGKGWRKKDEDSINLAGDFTLTFDRLMGEKRAIQIAIEGNGHRGTADIFVEAVECPELARATQFFVGEGVQAWQLSHGTASGRLVAAYGEDYRPFLDGELSLQDLAFAHTALDMSGTVQEARLQLFDLKSSMNPESDSTPIGKLELLRDANLTFYQDGKPHWEIQHLSGGLHLEAQHLSRIQIDGICLHQGEPSRLHVEGKALLLGVERPFADLSLTLRSPFQDEVSVRFRAEQTTPNSRVLEFQCAGVSKAEFEVLQNLVPNSHAFREAFVFKHGSFDGSVKATVRNNIISSVAIEGVHAEDLGVEFPLSGLEISCDNLDGQISCNLLSDNLLEGLDSDVTVVNGHIGFTRDDEKLWQFSDIDAQFIVREGVVEKSLATATFAGLRGEIELDWLSQEEIVSFNFSGHTEDILPFLSGSLREKVSRGFRDEHVHLEAGVSRKLGALAVEGIITLAAPELDGEQIHFGFDLEKVSQKVWEDWKTERQGNAELKDLGMVAVRGLMPPSAAPSAPLLNRWVDEEFGVFGLLARDGWFYAKDLPMHKYLEAALFDDERISLTGDMTLKGKFTNQRVQVQYVLDGVVLEAPGYRIDLPKLGNHKALDQGQDSVGKHFFDLKSGRHFGFLQLENASYTNKKFDLLFENVDTRIVVEDRRMHFTDLECESEGVFFAGRIDVDLLEPGASSMDVEFRTSEISSTVASARAFFQHFDAAAEGEIPLTGQLYSPDQGGYLRIAVRPEGDDVELYFVGGLTEGQMQLPDSQVHVDELSMNFDYNLQANALSLSDLQGKLLVGESGEQDAYNIHSRYIRIFDFPQHQLEFDVRIEDSTRDLVRVKGTGRSLEDPEHGQIIAFDLHPEHSYLGEIRPNISVFKVKGLDEIIAFRAEPVLNLSSAVDDVVRLARTGWLTRSSHNLGVLKDYDLSGQIQAKVHLNPADGHYHFSAQSDDLVVDDRKFENFFLGGKKAGKQWSIDQLQIDEMSLAADILVVEDGWKLNFLGLRYSDAALLGIEGQYLTGEDSLQTRLNLFEIDLEKLETLPIPTSWAEVVDPKGKIRAAGDVTFHFDEVSGPPRISADLKASFRDLEIADIELEDREGIPFTIDSLKGVSIGSMEIAVKETEKDPNGVQLWLEGIDVDIQAEELSFNGLRFELPAEQLSWLAQMAQASRPDLVSNTAAEAICEIKDSGSLMGTVDLKLSPTYYQLELKLDQDEYRLLKEQHEVRNFFLSYDPYELQFRTEYKIKGDYYWMAGRSSSNALNTGQLFVGAQRPDPDAYNEAGLKPLMVLWKWDEDLALQIQRAEGNFEGLDFNLNQDADNTDPALIAMVGQVGIDAKLAGKFFDTKVQKAFGKFEVGKGYEYSGHYTLNKEKMGDITFDGMLVGKDIEFKGYEFNTLFAQVQYEPGHIQVEDLKLLDNCGELRIEKLQTWKDDPKSEWEMYVPSLVVEDFKPSLLRKPGGTPKKPKPLTITHLEVKEIKGKPGDSKSITGQGQLQFINPKRKHARNTLLVIPQDILSRIGLDPDVMTPVGGTVTYTVSDGRVYFDQMKDVYSEGRLSKFYLPTRRYQSSMDFDGNLDMRVRMKQYNLIFKIAELFTIGVDGTLEAPNYTLKKQTAQKGAQMDQAEDPDGDEVVRAA